MKINVDTLAGKKKDFLELTINSKEYIIKGIPMGVLITQYAESYSPEKLRDAMVEILEETKEAINKIDGTVLTIAFGVILKWHYGMSEAEILAEDQKDSKNP